jgi:NAD(P)-dependent dehydrogenase (short-subunit alcohol dehydrogenase family)
MREQEWGRIVNIASEAATLPDDFKPHYDSSKAAIVNLTKNLSKTYGEEGVLVNSVSPATANTPMVQQLFEERAEEEGKTIEEVRREFIREDCPNIVFDRLTQPEEVADVVAFLASERASYVTGSNYRVDGGSVPSINI